MSGETSRDVRLPPPVGRHAPAPGRQTAENVNGDPRVVVREVVRRSVTGRRARVRIAGSSEGVAATDHETAPTVEVPSAVVGDGDRGLTEDEGGP